MAPKASSSSSKSGSSKATAGSSKATAMTSPAHTKVAQGGVSVHQHQHKQTPKTVPTPAKQRQSPLSLNRSGAENISSGSSSGGESKHSGSKSQRRLDLGHEKKVAVQEEGEEEGEEVMQAEQVEEGLKFFDLTVKYGPSIGMTRMER